MNLLCCDDFKDAPSCCGSCHSDASDGFRDLSLRVPDGQSWLYPKTEAYVCCTVSDWLRQDRTKFAVALNLHRKVRKSHALYPCE